MSARAVAVYALDEVGEALLRAAGELFPHEPAAEVAASIYRRARALGLVRGWRGVKVVMAASIYAATRILGLPASVEEVASAAGASVRDVMRSYWALRRYLDFKASPIAPEKYVARICGEWPSGTKLPKRLPA